MKEQNKSIRKQGRKISRREFLRGGGAAAAAFTIVPRYVLGGARHTPPSEKLNIAFIGAGGQGQRNTAQLSSENIAALCDVDEERAAKTFQLYPKAKKYRDFRKMLEKEKNIDAVVVTTPDHTHAVAAMMALKMGKHVYCEKPLTHSIYEARILTEAAREAKVVTQMGIHHHVAGHCGWAWRLSGLALSAKFTKCICGRAGQRSCGPREWLGRRVRRRCRRLWTGICGWGRHRIGHIIRLMCPSNGVAGGISGRGRLVIWAVT